MKTKLTTYSCNSCSLEASLLTRIFSLCDASEYCCLYFSSDSRNEEISPARKLFFNLKIHYFFSPSGTIPYSKYFKKNANLK